MFFNPRHALVLLILCNHLTSVFAQTVQLPVVKEGIIPAVINDFCKWILDHKFLCVSILFVGACIECGIKAAIEG
ncbi:unnamed protein product, partial [Mesorhabditis belari]|uniref:Uncharacterized protein n=1 Tax=Mesorhabditis belari TaxID=2138241 RepID=A0AAF3EX00_9BILA